MVNLTFEDDNELKQRISEAANYLLLKNKNFVFLSVDGVLYDIKEKKYYDMNSGECYNDNE